MWRFTFLALSLTPCIVSQDADPVRALFEGRQLTAEQAAAAGAAIQANPDDWQDRVRMLGYYTTQAKLPGATESIYSGRVQQILWLIEHHPEMTVLRFPDAAIPLVTPNAAVMGGLEEAKQAWQPIQTMRGCWETPLGSFGSKIKISRLTYCAARICGVLVIGCSPRSWVPNSL